MNNELNIALMFFNIFLSKILCKCVSIWKVAYERFLIFFDILLSHSHDLSRYLFNVQIILVYLFLNMATQLIAVYVSS